MSISIGSGAALARQSSDLVLISDDLRQIPKTIGIARRSEAILRQNLGWAVAYNLLAMAAFAWAVRAGQLDDMDSPAIDILRDDDGPTAQAGPDMPCGLSSTVLIAAWLQADALNSAGTMAAFGLGTLPVMLPLTWSGARMGQWLNRSQLRGVAGSLVLLAGLLTMSAPWLMQSPTLHGLLSALGCQPLRS